MAALPLFMWSTTVQMLISNHQRMTVEQLAAICCQQVESDSMLLFLRAVTAAEMAANELMEVWAASIREALPESYR